MLAFEITVEQVNQIMSQLAVSAFDITVELKYRELSSPITQQITQHCELKQFALTVPKVARFIALPEDNCIVIEKADPGVPDNWIHPWLYGTVFAYVLQYHGYIVLHGSAILLNNKAIIFSGQSGSGKSTLASSFVQKGYPLITDDLVVIKLNENNQYCIIPGPPQIKLWQDAADHLQYDLNNATPIHFRINKYAIPISEVCQEKSIPVCAFYELNSAGDVNAYMYEKLSQKYAVKILMQNAYRYFMLKPLGKVSSFFYACSSLSQKIEVYKMQRPNQFNELSNIIQRIETCY